MTVAAMAPPTSGTEDALKAQPDATAQDAGLVLAGLRAMVSGVVADLKSPEESARSRALSALVGMARKAGRAVGGGQAQLQACFAEAGGFEALVATLAADDGGPFRHEPALAGAAVDSLVALTKSGGPARGAAVSAGAAGALVRLLGAGDSAPVSVGVLRALAQLLGGGGEAGHAAHRALVAAGGLRALLRLLDSVMLGAGEPDASAWGREVAAVLFELVRAEPTLSGPLVAAGGVGSVLKILSVCECPLAMSLALDILEEVVNCQDRGAVRSAMMAEGAVPALLRVMHVKGVGSKAMLALAFLGEDAAHLPVLVPCLDTDDVACACHIAALAADADDLDAGACIEFIAALISTAPLPLLRHLVAARCVGVALTLEPMHAALLGALGGRGSGPAMGALLDNATTYGRLEGALAAVELLLAGLTSAASAALPPPPSASPLARLLRRNGKLEALVTVCLDEAVAGGSGEGAAAADNEVTTLLADLLDSLPAEAPAGPELPVSSSSSGGKSAGAGFSAADVNARRYDSVTFLVGGREFYALGWVLEQASARLARLLAHVDDARAAPLGVPAVPGMPPGRQYEMFTLATEYAYTGWVDVAPSAALDLWALAACLEMDALQSHCEGVVMRQLVPTAATLEPALELGYKYRAGNRLRDACCGFVLANLRGMAADGRLAGLVTANRPKLQEGLIRALAARLAAAAGSWAGEP